jgi:hypothetical protein
VIAEPGPERLAARGAESAIKGRATIRVIKESALLMIGHSRWKMTFGLCETGMVSMEGKKSKRGRVGEGRPTKRTQEVIAKIAEAVAIGLTDREAGLLAGVRYDTMTERREDPEFSAGNGRVPSRHTSPS